MLLYFALLINKNFDFFMVALEVQVRDAFTELWANTSHSFGLVFFSGATRQNYF